MKVPLALTLGTCVLLTGCTSSPRSQDIVRRSTAAVTRTVASDVKGAALGIRDGLRHDPNNDAVDVNNAPREKLETLPGINAELAGKIITARPYKSPGDLVRRRLIPKTTYEKIRSRLVAH